MHNSFFQHLVLLLFFGISAQAQSTLAHLSNSELTERFADLTDKYAGLVSYHSLGNTINDNSIDLVTLANGNPESKPAVLLVAGVDPRDLAGSEILLSFVATMARDYGKVDSVTAILDRVTFYILPRVNPDATESLFATPRYARRLNSRPVDLDKDGFSDEDGYDDLNKDGHITWMRITEPGGQWIEDPDYPELLKKADALKGENGIYTLLHEGMDNDGDGLINEDEPGGVNFNQNFTFKYDLFNPGSGAYQISEIETRAVADFCFNHPNIALIFTFSENDNLLQVWEAAKAGKPETSAQGAKLPVEHVDAGDAKYYHYISEEYKKHGQTEVKPDEAGNLNGSFAAWAYFHFGRWSLSTPAWMPPLTSGDQTSNMESDMDSTADNDQEAPKRNVPENDKNRDQRLWEWVQNTGQANAFVPWKEYAHPDYPDTRVEIGGFKPLPAYNPPVDSIVNVAEKYMPFFLQLANWLPKISAENLKVENLSANVYRVSLRIRNSGHLPSNTFLGKVNKWCPKIKVVMTLSKEQKLASGKPVQFIDILESNSTGKEYSWVILSKKNQSVSLNIGSPMTGVLKRNIKLN